MGENEPRRAYPTLSMPYDGEFKEILTELRFNKGKFFPTITKGVFRENTPLLLMFYYDRNDVPNLEVAFDLFVLYYEIWSRAAKKKGSPMLVINEETGKMLDILQKRQQQAQLTLVDDGFEEIYQEISAEISENPEIKEFWKYVDKVRKELGFDEDEMSKTTRPVSDLNAVLISQHLINTAVNSFRAELDSADQASH